MIAANKRRKHFAPGNRPGETDLANTPKNIVKGKIRMKITVCIGSSCHIKGSHRVVEELQSLIAENGLSNKVSLSGEFCMGKCQLGVCVTVDGEFFSVSPDKVKEFFEENILKVMEL